MCLLHAPRFTGVTRHRPVDGSSKARYFRDRGFYIQNMHEFADELKQHAATQTITREEATPHGRKYVVECIINTPDRRNPCILTVWIEVRQSPPRLVTAHPNS